MNIPKYLWMCWNEYEDGLEYGPDYEDPGPNHPMKGWYKFVRVDDTSAEPETSCTK